VGRLGTITSDDRPHVVPFVFAVDGETVYWAVDAKPKRSDRLKRLDNIRANAAAEVVVDGYDEDWSRLWWIRASGRARVVEDAAERGQALRLLDDKYPQYAKARPTGPVVAIDVARWSWWSAT